MTTSHMLDNLPPGMRIAVAVSSETPNCWRIDDCVSYAMIVLSMLWFPAHLFGHFAGAQTPWQLAIGFVVWVYVVYSAFKIKLYCNLIRFHFASDVTFDAKFMAAYERIRREAEGETIRTATTQTLIIPGKRT